MCAAVGAAKPGERRGRRAIWLASCEETCPGDQLLVLGAHAALGAWNPQAALRLETSEGRFPIWQGCVHVPESGGQGLVEGAYSPKAIEWKLAVRRADGRLQWEPGANRCSVPPAGSSSEAWILRAAFGRAEGSRQGQLGDDGLLAVRWAEAEREVSSGTAEVGLATPVGELADHRHGDDRGLVITWEALCSATRPGDVLLVVGSASELGAWDPLQALRLETAADVWPTWRGTIKLTSVASSAPVAWKLALLRAGGSIDWEPLGADRFLNIGCGGGEELILRVMFGGACEEEWRAAPPLPAGLHNLQSSHSAVPGAWQLQSAASAAATVVVEEALEPEDPETEHPPETPLTVVFVEDSAAEEAAAPSALELRRAGRPSSWVNAANVVRLCLYLSRVVARRKEERAAVEALGEATLLADRLAPHLEAARRRLRERRMSFHPALAAVVWRLCCLHAQWIAFMNFHAARMIHMLRLAMFAYLHGAPQDPCQKRKGERLPEKGGRQEQRPAYEVEQVGEEPTKEVGPDCEANRESSNEEVAESKKEWEVMVTPARCASAGRSTSACTSPACPPSIVQRLNEIESQWEKFRKSKVSNTVKLPRCDGKNSKDAPTLLQERRRQNPLIFQASPLRRRRPPPQGGANGERQAPVAGVGVPSSGSAAAPAVPAATASTVPISTSAPLAAKGGKEGGVMLAELSLEDRLQEVQKLRSEEAKKLKELEVLQARLRELSSALECGVANQRLEVSPSAFVNASEV
mmetsp:Transcript_42295/g.106594  ORF Transcript_42295/g.106594 Transcript_42295/m.106594 type:complete len:752 (+) Transcript_42295:54-2309(+)